MQKFVRALMIASLAAMVSPSDGTAQSGDGTVARASRAKPLPGDRIFVHILREPLMSDTVTVSERGDAAFPKLGVLPVSSWSIVQLSDTLRSRYAEYLRTPELEILVLRRVVVDGEIAKPNVYLVDVSATVSDVIARAGGFTPSANRNSIRLVRGDSTRRIRGGDLGRTMNYELQSGDQVIVGRRNWLTLNALPAVSTLAVMASVLIALRR